jgi:hypothetical protein
MPGTEPVARNAEPLQEFALVVARSELPVAVTVPTAQAEQRFLGPVAARPGAEYASVPVRGYIAGVCALQRLRRLRPNIRGRVPPALR